jgi:hypothetical protein
MTQRRSNIPADGKVNIRASQKIFRDVEGPSDIPPAQKTAANIIRGLPDCEYSGIGWGISEPCFSQISEKSIASIIGTRAEWRNGGMMRGCDS